jgi:hypothetical protein
MITRSGTRRNLARRRAPTGFRISHPPRTRLNPKVSRVIRLMPVNGSSAGMSEPDVAPPGPDAVGVSTAVLTAALG